MKVFAITISDVYDFEDFPHAPVVTTSKEKAMSRLRDIYKEAKEMLVENGNDWVEDEFNEKSTCFSMYPEGEWGTSHYDARIDEVEVEE